MIPLPKYVGWDVLQFNSVWKKMLLKAISSHLSQLFNEKPNLFWNFYETSYTEWNTEENNDKNKKRE